MGNGPSEDFFDLAKINTDGFETNVVAVVGVGGNEVGQL